ncbi:MAG TPA: GNAT family N-acetyltransferase [Thermomicrobiales bacterium]|jgi:GNAT superfamily N-acetyltransferase
MIADAYTIRRAQPAELGQLPAIERAAAAQFRATPFAALADAPLSAEEIDPARDQIWVAVAPTDEPVGFALVHRLATVAHLHELDVHPAHARRGLGRRLIEAVARWAEGEGLRALTLTTFRDIPWNAPYYARLGFRSVGADELSAELRAISAAEAAAGLPVHERISMRRDLA